VVDGVGSTWTIDNSLFVGLDGTGHLSITNGGIVTVNGPFALIGETGSSNGTVTVDGTGSTWTIANELDVGLEGTGTLKIANGGVVSVSGNYRQSSTAHYRSRSQDLCLGSAIHSRSAAAPHSMARCRFCDSITFSQ
jgi:T5SS/PEP-CTERM-associated repeat protein